MQSELYQFALQIGGIALARDTLMLVECGLQDYRIGAKRTAFRILSKCSQLNEPKIGVLNTVYGET
ncbi:MULTISPECIES: hypothetical protein [unclassified Pseudovibrio]|uniref:hypothetical protein n=1 Tax=unclassified Pseudovibrio TaxID=2627060 RepID=UPI0007AEDFBD|nr:MULTISPECIES: hypothetical protein [unclassified Pseudovibrio]